MIARRRSLGAHLDGGTYVLELEVVGLGAILDEAQLALRIAGVSDARTPTHSLELSPAGDGEPDWSTSPLSASCSTS